MLCRYAASLIFGFAGFADRGLIGRIVVKGGSVGRGGTGGLVACPFATPFGGLSFIFPLSWLVSVAVGLDRSFDGAFGLRLRLMLTFRPIRVANPSGRPSGEGRGGEETSVIVGLRSASKLRRGPPAFKIASLSR